MDTPVPTPRPSPPAIPDLPAGAKPASLTALAGNLTQEVQDANTKSGQLYSNANDVLSNFHTQMGDLKASIPKPPSDAPFQAPEQVNPISAFGSSAGLLAGIASMFTRAPLTTSLNAMASGMQAIKDGNALAYQKSFKEWTANTEHAFKSFDAQNKAYDNLINLAKTDYDGAMTGIKTLAAMTDDQAAHTAMAMNGIEGVAKLNMDRQRLNLETQEAATKLIPAHLYNQAIDQYKVQHGLGKNENIPVEAAGRLWQQAQTGFFYDQSSSKPAGSVAPGDPNYRTGNPMVDSIGHYQTAPLPVGRGGQNLAIMQQVEAAYPNYRAPMFAGIQKSWLDFQPGGKDGALVASGNKAIQHLGLLEQAFNALQNHDPPALNDIRMKWLKATGSALPTNYDAIAGVAAGELANFAVGNGVRGTALDDRKGMAETISRSMSSGQGMGAMDQYVGLMAGQMDAKRWQYNAAHLDEMQPFDALLMPETRAVLARHTGMATGGGKDFSHLWGGK